MRTLYILLIILIILIIIGYFIIRSILNLDKVDIINVLTLQNWNKLNIDGLSDTNKLILVVVAFSIATIYILFLSLLSSAIANTEIDINLFK